MSLHSLVTGANRGLGAALVKQLVENGHTVIAAARAWPPDTEHSSTSSSDGHPAIRRVTLDVTRADSREALVQQLLKERVHVNNLVNCAAVFLPWSAAEFSLCLVTNCTGPLALAERMVEAGLLNNGSHVVNVSSGLGKLATLAPPYQQRIQAAASLHDLASLSFDPDSAMATQFMGSYCVSKAALNRGTRLLAAKWQRDGVRVNSVDPGWCATRMGGLAAPRKPHEGAASIAAIVLGSPADVGSGHFYSSRGARTPF